MIRADNNKYVYVNKKAFMSFLLEGVVLTNIDL